MSRMKREKLCGLLNSHRKALEKLKPFLSATVISVTIQAFLTLPFTWHIFFHPFNYCFYFLMCLYRSVCMQMSVCVFFHTCVNMFVGMRPKVEEYLPRPLCTLLRWSHAEPQFVLTILLVQLASLPRRCQLNLPAAGVTGRLPSPVFMWVPEFHLPRPRFLEILLTRNVMCTISESA